MAAGDTALLQCTGWQVTFDGETVSYNTCTTAGNKGRASAQNDWTATVTGFWLGAVDAAFVNNTILSWAFYEQAADATSLWYGNGMIERIDIDIDVEGGGPITYTYNIGGAGVLTPRTAGAEGVPISSKTGKVQWSATLY